MLWSGPVFSIHGTGRRTVADAGRRTRLEAVLLSNLYDGIKAERHLASGVDKLTRPRAMPMMAACNLFHSCDFSRHVTGLYSSSSESIFKRPLEEAGRSVNST